MKHTHGIDDDGNAISFEDIRARCYNEDLPDNPTWNCCGSERYIEGLDTVYDWFRTSAPGANLVTYKINMIHMHQDGRTNQPFYDINIEFVDGVATVVSARHPSNFPVRDELLEIMSERISAWFALHNIDQYESGGMSYKQVMATFSKLGWF